MSEWSPETGRACFSSVHLNLFNAREIGIEPSGHAAARLPHAVKFGHRAIESEIAPGVGDLIAVKLNDDGAALAGFRVYEVADVFHGYPSAIGDDNNTESKLCWRVAS